MSTITIDNKEIPRVSEMIRRYRIQAESTSLGVVRLSKEELQTWEALIRAQEELLEKSTTGFGQMDFFTPKSLKPGQKVVGMPNETP